jgi:hypothetical protein
VYDNSSDENPFRLVFEKGGGITGGVDPPPAWLAKVLG